MTFYLKKKVKEKNYQHCVVTFSQNDSLIIFESAHVHISSHYKLADKQSCATLQRVTDVYHLIYSIHSICFL